MSTTAEGGSACHSRPGAPNENGSTSTSRAAWSRVVRRRWPRRSPAWTVNKEAWLGEARTRSRSSTDDISSGRRGGLGPIGGRGAGRTKELGQRGPRAGDQGPLEDDQGSVGARARPAVRTSARVGRPPTGTTNEIVRSSSSPSSSTSGKRPRNRASARSGSAGSSSEDRSSFGGGFAADESRSTRNRTPAPVELGPDPRDAPGRPATTHASDTPSLASSTRSSSTPSWRATAPANRRAVSRNAGSAGDRQLEGGARGVHHPRGRTAFRRRPRRSRGS